MRDIETLRGPSPWLASGHDPSDEFVRRGERFLESDDTVRARCIDYTESGESHGTMILDGVCYSVIHFFRVILSRMVEPSCSQSSKLC